MSRPPRFALALVVLLLTGCPERPGPGAPSEAAEAGGPDKATRRSGCDRTLSVILEGLGQDRIGAGVDVETKAADLNGWLRKCAEETPGLADDGSDRKRILPPPVDELTRGRKFTVADVRHVRAAQFSAAIVGGVRATDDVGRAVEAMRLVAGHLAYLDGANGFLGVPLPRLWLTGVATSPERTLAFIELLRQMGLDAAVLQMPAGGGFPEYQIVAVPAGGKTYLFDPILGLPIPSPGDEGAVPTKPLTLAEGKRDDAAFRALDTVLSKYPVTSLRLKTARVQVCVSPSLLSDRMALLQDNLPVDTDVVVYQGLGDNAFAETGLLGRVAAATGVDAASIKPWPFPVLLATGALRRSEPVEQLLALREEVLRGPWSMLMRRNEKGEPEPVFLSSAAGDDTKLRDFEKGLEQQRRRQEAAERAAAEAAERARREAAGERVADEEFLRADAGEADEPVVGRELVDTLAQGRAYLLAGRTKEAFRAFMRSRIAELTDDRFPAGRANLMGRADATYWIALAQRDQGQEKAAGKEFERLLTNPAGGLWAAAARRGYAELLASQGDYETAVAVAEVELPEPSLLVLAKRWRRLGGLPTQEDLVDQAKAEAAAKAAGEAAEQKTSTAGEEAPTETMPPDKTPPKKDDPAAADSGAAAGDQPAAMTAAEGVPEAEPAPRPRPKAPAANPTRGGSAE